MSAADAAFVSNKTAIAIMDMNRTSRDSFMRFPMPGF
jgi:hypothetical protein